MVTLCVFGELEKVEKDFVFEFGENTFVYQSCSLTYKNEFFVFGGSDSSRNPNQISKLSGCRLERIGTLGFNHEFGTCTSVADTRIYLCFNIGPFDVDKCRYAENPLDTFSEAPPSSFPHKEISIAASDSKLAFFKGVVVFSNAIFC